MLGLILVRGTLFTYCVLNLFAGGAGHIFVAIIFGFALGLSFQKDVSAMLKAIFRSIGAFLGYFIPAFFNKVNVAIWLIGLVLFPCALVFPAYGEQVFTWGPVNIILALVMIIATLNKMKNNFPALRERIHTNFNQEVNPNSANNNNGT